MREYELTVLLRPDLTEKELDKEMKLLTDLLSKNGAKVKSKKDAVKRTLAYPVAKQMQAYYVYLELEMDSDKVAGVDEKLRLEEKIIRYLLVSHVG